MHTSKHTVKKKKVLKSVVYSAIHHVLLPQLSQSIRYCTFPSKEMRLASTLKRLFSLLAASLLRSVSFHRSDPRPWVLQSTRELAVLLVVLVLLIVPELDVELELVVVPELVALPVLVVQVLLILLQSSESVSAVPKHSLRWEPRNLSLAGLSGTRSVRFFGGLPGLGLGRGGGGKSTSSRNGWLPP